VKTKLISNEPKTWAVIFDTGDAFPTALTKFAEDAGLDASRFTAIGAFEKATLGYFDWEKKDYVPIEVDEQVEVLALTGDIAVYDGKPQVHAHAVVGRRDGSTIGGHVLDAVVRPTLEIIVDEARRELHKHYDPETGLALIDL
jgi:hypothetical protein